MSGLGPRSREGRVSHPRWYGHLSKPRSMTHRFRKWSRKIDLQPYYIRRHLKEFSASIGRCDCMVDVGSGETGPYLDLFDFGVCVGLDRFEHADLIADAGALPLRSAQADLVLCTEVLEHVPDPLRALAEMNRVLIPGGGLILTTPLVWGEHDHVDNLRWTEAGLRRIVLSAGFEVQELRRRGGVFAALGCMITRVPVQVFGPWDAQSSWLSRAVYIGSWLLTLPLPWLLLLLDPLDRTRAYTSEFSVLCRKARC
jgi:SAM-dependent methyltransferase